MMWSENIGNRITSWVDYHGMEPEWRLQIGARSPPVTSSMIWWLLKRTKSQKMPIFLPENPRILDTTSIIGQGFSRISAQVWGMGCHCHKFGGWGCHCLPVAAIPHTLLFLKAKYFSYFLHKLPNCVHFENSWKRDLAFCLAFPPVRQQEVLQLVNALLEGVVGVVGVVGVGVGPPYILFPN